VPAPTELYLRGLQRKSFLPFITDLQARCVVHGLQSTTDYRHLAASASGVARLTPAGDGTYVHPLSRESAGAVDQIWNQLTDGGPTGPHSLQLSGRALRVPLASAHAARFTFDQLCGQPLGPEDYLKLARAFGAVVVEGVPQLSLNEATELRRLINLVDTCYDGRVLLVLSAAQPMDALFKATGADSHTDKFGDVIGNIVQESGDESFAFTRTLSRLQEMRSEAYVAESKGAHLRGRRDDSK